MARREDLKQVLLRIPSDINDWVAREAYRNCSSKNSAIVSALRTKMEELEREKAVR
ncbi:hypothetical protein [Bradyrhizobium diazoefficiens]|uniref:hypothetical protein n=1 Tax=Bradyrhizobium diazoefficiens TaxID=1355477 RepID=UPI0015CF7EE7|nr:hypothetical protein [Bradyrhizobium diazoefficiens]WLB40525.1 hypothetical protein QIH78_12310 [Bradyrhizobium diazoefficiens]WLC14498.1 hypothetical protein QIH76_30725 [Bradyrhizobium diazoefficiens]